MHGEEVDPDARRRRALRRPAALAVAVAAAVAGSFAPGTPAAAPPPEPIRVVASVPNLGAIAHAVGGDRIDLTAIATGVQDAHFVDPKPSFIVKLRKADLLLVNGLDLEIGWVPPLTQGARNARILPGAEDYVDCSTRIGVLEAPQGPVSRVQGDVHPYGNPHYLADPLNAEIVAGQIAEALSRKSPADAASFAKRLAEFVRRLHVATFGPELVEMAGGAKLSRLAREGGLEAFLETTVLEGRPLAERPAGWIGRLRPHAGARIVTYHRDWSYFARRFGLEVIDSVEPKPGIPPSAKHLVELTDRLAAGGVRLIVTRPYVEHRSTSLLAERTGVTVLTLPLEVGGAPEASDYIALFDHVTARVAEALAAPAGAASQP